MPKSIYFFDLLCPGTPGVASNVDAYLTCVGSSQCLLRLASLTPEIEPSFWSAPLTQTEINLQEHVAGVAEADAEGKAQPLAHVLMTKEMYCFGCGLNVDMPGRSHPIIGFRRSPRGSEAQDALEVPTRSRHSVSCWHGASQSVVSASWVSECARPVYAVDRGSVWVEVVDVANAQVRHIILGKVPGLGLSSASQAGCGTDTSLAGQGMLLTKRESPDGRIRKEPVKVEMPSCIACCEMGDGRLALLFADSHIRILEIRRGPLAVQEALYSSMQGMEEHTSSFPGEQKEEPLDILDIQDSDAEGSEGDSDEGEDADDETSDGDMSDSVGGTAGGSGKGPRGKRGSGRRGFRSRNSRSGSGKGRARGQHSQGKLIQESKEGAGKVLQQARERAMLAVGKEKFLFELADQDLAKYDELFRTVEKEVLQLRVILQSVEARERERTWLRGKTTGELDDSKIVDLAIGEKNVFKHRGLREDPSMAQSMPKRLSFVVDVSGSMAIFNGDGRLDRLCASMVMIMEALSGLEHKYMYEIIGHSGETDWLPFVQMGKAPRNRAERFAVVNAMADHASFARSGDNTLAAAIKATAEIAKEKADDYFVFLISDANLRGYGILPQDLAAALTGDQRINAHVIFIAEPEIAEEMRVAMPAGHAHLVLDTEDMPLLLKNIFARAVLTGLTPSKL